MATSVTDNATATTVTLSSASAASVSEGGSVVYTASVNNAVTGSDLVVTLSNGQTVTIPVGSSTANVTYTVRADDPYVQGNALLNVGISGTAGGNYEALSLAGTVATSVTDNATATMATLTASATVAEGVPITYTASLGSPVTGSDVVVTLSNGAQITIPVGQSTGSVSVPTPANSGGSNISVAIAGVAGGNFEVLSANALAATTAVTDGPFVSAPIPDQSATPGTSFSYAMPTGTFADADTPVLTYTATQADGSPLPGWLAFDPATGTFSGVPPAGFASIDLKVTASDGTLSASDQFRISAATVVVTPQTQAALPPVAPSAPPATAGALPGISPLPAASADSSAAASGGTAAPQWNIDPTLPSSNLAGSLAGTVSAGTSTPPAPAEGSVADLVNALPPPAFTQGFPVLQIAASESGGTGQGADQFKGGDDQLYVYLGVRDVRSMANGGYEIQVPRDAFAHTDPTAVVRLEATQADGTPLPGWLNFDRQSGLLSGTPPNQRAGDIEIKITARDDAGREASVSFRPVLGPSGATSQLASAGDIAAAQRVGALSGDLLKPAASDLQGLADKLMSATGISGIDSGRVQTGLRGFDAMRLPDDDPSVTRDAALMGGTGYRLFVYNGISTMTLDDAGTFRVPADAFAHTDPSAIVLLEARLASGSPLPSWLSFDGVTGQFSGTPPEGMRGAIELEVTAKDTDGREAHANFRLVVGEVPVAESDAAADGQNSRLGLAVDKEVADKLREKAIESAKQPAIKAPHVGKPVADDKPVVRGSASFSEQLMVARATQDSLIGRITRSEADEPPQSP